MKKVKVIAVAIGVGSLCASAVEAETFVVDVKGVVRSVGGQSGGVLEAVQPGDPVTQTFVFDTARFPSTTGDGATSLVYTNAYVSPVEAVRSRTVVGAVRFDVEGYPVPFEAVGAFDSFVPPTPTGIPPPPPADRFTVSDMSAAVALNVPDARGLVRWAAFGTTAPAASSMVPVPVTSLTNVNIAEATGFAWQLVEGEGWVNPAPPSGLPVGTITFSSSAARFVTMTVQSVTLRRCSNRLHWLEAGLPWPKRGVHCESEEDEDEDDHD